jgi:hypothetical protein
MIVRDSLMKINVMKPETFPFYSVLLHAYFSLQGAG